MTQDGEVAEGTAQQGEVQQESTEAGGRRSRQTNINRLRVTDTTGVLILGLVAVILAVALALALRGDALAATLGLAPTSAARTRSLRDRCGGSEAGEPRT